MVLLRFNQAPIKLIPSIIDRIVAEDDIINVVMTDGSSIIGYMIKNE